MNVRPETVKLLVRRKHRQVSSLTVIFLDLTPKAKATKAKINKRDYIKPKSFCVAKETINKIKRQLTCSGHGFEPRSRKIPHAAEQLGP